MIHATDEAYFDKSLLLEHPAGDCADDDAATTCKDSGRLGRGLDRAPRLLIARPRRSEAGAPRRRPRGARRRRRDRADDDRDARPAPALPSAARRLAAAAIGAPRRGSLALLLAAPLGWLVIAYLGALFVLLLNAFWAKDRSPARSSRSPGRSTLPGARQRTRSTATIAMRTIGMAALVTVTDALLAFPIAYYMARIASPRTRGAARRRVLMPLWAAYLVKVYAWRTILQGNGFVDWVLEPFGIDGAGPRRALQRLARPSATSGCRT